MTSIVHTIARAQLAIQWGLSKIVSSYGVISMSELKSIRSFEAEAETIFCAQWPVFTMIIPIMHFKMSAA